MCPTPAMMPPKAPTVEKIQPTQRAQQKASTQLMCGAPGIPKGSSRGTWVDQARSFPCRDFWPQPLRVCRADRAYLPRVLICSFGCSLGCSLACPKAAPTATREKTRARARARKARFSKIRCFLHNYSPSYKKLRNRILRSPRSATSVKSLEGLNERRPRSTVFSFAEPLFSLVI